MSLPSFQQNISETEEEVLSLRRQLQILKERYLALQKQALQENERYKQHIEKLTIAAGEREKKVAELQRAGMALSEKLRQPQQGLQPLQEALKLEAQLKQDAVDETAALHAQFAILKTKFHALQLQGHEHEKEKQSWQDERGQLIHERDLGAQTLAQANARVEELQKAYAHLEAHLQTQAQEKEQLQEDNTKAKMAQEDAEARLKFAHHHLAKKVRETTELGDKIQAQEIQQREHEAHLNESQAENKALQGSLEEQAQQQKRLQEQWQESLNSAEAMVASWEEKYFQLHKKWQENEAYREELNRVNERYQHMQKLLSNINHFLSQPSDVQAKAEPPTLLSEKQVETELLKKAHEMYRPYQNLFDMPKPINRM